jgi:hypothetical protein
VYYIASVNSQVLEKSEKWACATFSVFSDTLTHEEIGEKLGIQATRTHAKGEPRSARKQSGVWPHSAWHLGSPLGYSANLADHIKSLLDSIEPKLAVLKAISAQCHPILLQCGFSSAHGQGGFTLDSDTLARISKLGVSLSVNLYPPGPPEGPDEGGK